MNYSYQLYEEIPTIATNSRLFGWVQYVYDCRGQLLYKIYPPLHECRYHGR